MIDIRFQEGEPIYKQIVVQILQKIRSGEMKPGEKLPPERELADHLQIARGTVNRAYKELANNNIIEVIQGSGSYVYNDRGVDGTEKRKMAMSVIAQMLNQLHDWELSNREIESLIRMCITKQEDMDCSIRMAIIDCTPETLMMIRRRLNYIPGIAITLILLDALLAEQDPQEMLAGYDLVITTVSHYEVVSRCLRSSSISVLVVDIFVSRQTLLGISSVVSNSKIGILCQSYKFAYLVNKHIDLFFEIKGPLPVHFVTTLKKAIKYMEKYSVIIMPPNLFIFDSPAGRAAKKVHQSNGGKIIYFDYTLNPNSLIHIEKCVDDVLRKKHEILKRDTDVQQEASVDEEYAQLI